MKESAKEAERGPDFSFRGPSVMDGKICPRFDLKRGTGQGEEKSFQEQRV